MNLGIYKWSTLNRFASADTIVPDPANPQSFNRYSYVLNNTLRYTDPTGHLSEDEIRDYFGYEADENITLRDKMIGAGWQDFLVDWLLNPDTHFGDVFVYDGAENTAMLVLFEAHSADSGIYEGGFYGLTGERLGKQVSKSNISLVNDDHPLVIQQESLYNNNWETLPQAFGSNGTPYYRPTTYLDLNGFDITFDSVGAGATIGGAACLIAEPCGAVVGGALTIVGVGALAVDLFIEDEPWSTNYPVIMQPQVNILGQLEYENIRHSHLTAPNGVYE